MHQVVRRLLSVLGAAALLTTLVVATPATAEPTDTAYPTLRGVSVTPSTVAVGSALAVTVDASDDVSLARMSITFVSTENSHRITTTRAWASDGRFSITVPSGSTTGGYRLRSVTLVDTSDKTAYYEQGRSLTLTPPIAGGPSTHTVDFAGATFSVTGGLDRTPPRITALAMPTRPAYDGDPGSLTVTVSETGPVKVYAWWYAPDESGVRSFTQTVQGGVGAVSFRLDGSGTHPFGGITVNDAAGNWRQYDRDGRERAAIATESGLTDSQHTLDLPRLDVTAKPQQPSATAIARPGSLRLLLEANEFEAKAITGWRVTVTPGDIVREVPVKVGPTQLDIGGLTNGTTYSVSVVAHSVVGDSKARVSTARPMLSTNVFAVADASGDRRVDLFARQPISAAGPSGSFVYPTNGVGAFSRRFAAFRAEETSCQRVAPGDVYIVGDSEVLCYGPSLLALMKDGSGHVVGTSGWSSMRFVDGGQDLTGDGWPDIVGVTSDGVLRIYQTGNQTRVVSTTTLGSGWNAFTALFQVGDFSGDRRADLVGVDSLGKLWLYPGNGRGGFGSRTLIGSGWGGFGAVIPLRDFTGDGRADIGAITMDGKLLLYPGNGRAGFLPKKEIGNGWGVFL